MKKNSTEVIIFILVIIVLCVILYPSFIDNDDDSSYSTNPYEYLSNEDYEYRPQPQNEYKPQETTPISYEDNTPTYQEEIVETVKNDVPKSDLSFFNQLKDDEKEIYQKIENACRKYQGEIKLNRVNREKVIVASYAIALDHPEFYWTSNKTITTENTDYVVAIHYDVPSNAKETIQRIDNIVDGIFEEMRSKGIYGDYDKLKYFYEWIVNNTNYGNSSSAQEMTSVFLDHTSVCAGYSKAFLYLCQKANIECAYVSGSTNNNESHAWNIVRYGDNYYWVDVTWGDPVFAGESDNKINYNYFMIDDNELVKNHVIDYNIKMATNYPTNRTISYPSCNDGSLNYYRKIGAYFDTYALYRVRNYFKEKFRNNIYEDIEIKFGDKNNYEAFLYDYLEKENAYIFDDVSEVRPLYYGTVRISYETIEGSCYAKITVSF